MLGTRERLHYEVFGLQHPRTLVFIHGWPDDHRMWRQQIEALAVNYRCVAVTLPNFGQSPDKVGGYAFARLVTFLKRTIEEVRLNDERVSLVTHDWGAYIGYLFERAHPDLVDRMIALDVGGHTKPTTLKEVGMILSYQWTLIGCWLIGGVIPFLGTRLSKGLAGVLKLSPVRIAGIHSRFNYPYFFLWMDILMPWRRKNLLVNYVPKCPTLFMYGLAKPVMFHSDRWLKVLSEHGGSYEAITDGDHWFMESHATQVNASIQRWLNQ
jgi:pimeloyl-ACP methyl ester carboxylesterase